MILTVVYNMTVGCCGARGREGGGGGVWWRAGGGGAGGGGGGGGAAGSELESCRVCGLASWIKGGGGEVWGILGGVIRGGSERVVACEEWGLCTHKILVRSQYTYGEGGGGGGVGRGRGEGGGREGVSERGVEILVDIGGGGGWGRGYSLICILHILDRADAHWQA
jgi:hypothetical protein